MRLFVRLTDFDWFRFLASRPGIDEVNFFGCVLLEQPFFLEERDWIPAPADWSRNIVRGKGYDSTVGEGWRRRGMGRGRSSIRGWGRGRFGFW